jgi:hypothetical protein
MVALKNDSGEPRRNERVVAQDLDVNDTPVPFGGEMVVMDDEPWELPRFSPEDVEAIGELLLANAQDPGFLKLLEAEIDAPTLAEVHVLHRRSEQETAEADDRD